MDNIIKLIIVAHFESIKLLPIFITPNSYAQQCIQIKLSSFSAHLYFNQTRSYPGQTLDYHPVQWVIEISDADLVSTLTHNNNSYMTSNKVSTFKANGGDLKMVFLHIGSKSQFSSFHKCPYSYLTRFVKMQKCSNWPGRLGSCQT